MKKIIRKTKEDLVKEINRLKKIIKNLVRLFIIIILAFPWSAVFLGAKVSIFLGIISVVISLCMIKYLRDKKII